MWTEGEGCMRSVKECAKLNACRSEGTCVCVCVCCHVKRHPRLLCLVLPPLLSSLTVINDLQLSGTLPSSFFFLSFHFYLLSFNISWGLTGGQQGHHRTKEKGNQGNYQTETVITSLSRLLSLAHKSTFTLTLCSKPWVYACVSVCVRMWTRVCVCATTSKNHFSCVCMCVFTCVHECEPWMCHAFELERDQTRCVSHCSVFPPP